MVFTYEEQNEFQNGTLDAKLSATAPKVKTWVTFNTNDLVCIVANEFVKAIAGKRIIGTAIATPRAGDGIIGLDYRRMSDESRIQISATNPAVLVVGEYYQVSDFQTIDSATWTLNPAAWSGTWFEYTGNRGELPIFFYRNF
jgi:hypothetical protein